MTDYNKIWIAVPTYWGDFGTLENPPTNIFDHPTNPNGNETLSRTLESLCLLEGDFNILIVLATTHKEYFNISKNRISKIITNLNTKKAIYLFTQENLEALSKITNQNILKLDTYGNIRNLQLFVPYTLEADIVIAIDDDEVVEDPYFVQKVADSFKNCNQAGGLSGPYYDDEGEYEIKNAIKFKNSPTLFESKIYYLNEGVKKEMTNKACIVPSAIAFGGNMSFTRDTIQKVCHDPFIPRGEDCDYLINCLMFGIRFYFNSSLKIVHLPPSADASEDSKNIRKIKSDIIRFLYMNYKLKEYTKITNNTLFDYSVLNPYPGVFICKIDDLVEQAKKVLLDASGNSLSITEVNEFLEINMNICKKQSKEYFIYQKQWCNLLKMVEKSKTCKNILLNCKMI